MSEASDGEGGIGTSTGDGACCALEKNQYILEIDTAQQKIRTTVMSELGAEEAGDLMTSMGGGRSTLLRTDRLGEDATRSIAHCGPAASDRLDSVVGRKKDVSNESLTGSGSAIDRTEGEGRRIEDS